MTQNIMVINKLPAAHKLLFFHPKQTCTVPWIHPQKQTGPCWWRNSCVPTAVVPPVFPLTPKEYHWRIITWIISQWWEIPWVEVVVDNLSQLDQPLMGWVMRWFRASMVQVPFQNDVLLQGYSKVFLVGGFNQPIWKNMLVKVDHLID